MTLAIDQLGIESTLLLKIQWGGESQEYFYADKDIEANIGTCEGKILQANVISKTGTIGQSGVSKTASVTLDDTDGTLKEIYDSLRMEGSYCEVYQRIDQENFEEIMLFSGVVSSDIKWLEGDRALSFSIEGGTTKTNLCKELGYAPEENAIENMNPSAEGVNWPVVFGTAIKVPAVRLIYVDDLTLKDPVYFDTATFVITNGAQLPQAPTVITIEIDRVLFTGTMAEDVFTVLTRNDARYAGQPFAERTGLTEDVQNPCIAWVPEGVNLTGLYVYAHDLEGRFFTNHCIAQVGTQCTFEVPWFGYQFVDEDYTITEAARYCRTGWTTMFQSVTDGGNLYHTETADGWFLYKDAPVILVTGLPYADRYIANYLPTDIYNPLVNPHDTVLAVWGKRNFNGRVIWEKVPMAYYTVTTNTLIITEPNAVKRYATVIDFPKQLREYVCENWENDIYVSLTSTLPNTPLEITHWLCKHLIPYGFDTVLSDDPPVSMNFAYFETTDAMEFLKQIAYQSASAIQIIGDSIILKFLAKNVDSDASLTLTTDLVVMKSLELGFKPKEEINTIHKSVYYIDYSGEKTSKKLYTINQNVTEYGVKTVENNLWALTCLAPVKAVTDFWGVKDGNSWKTIKLDCFLDVTDAEAFDAVTLDLEPFVRSGVMGLITSVTHDTDRPIVTLEIELAVKAGTDSEDSSFWDFGPATCTAYTDSEEDYVPTPDPKCPSWSISLGTKTVKPVYHAVIVTWPPKVIRGVPFTLKFELQDDDDILYAVTAFAEVKIYTDNPNDCFFVPNITFVGGKATLEGINLRGSMLRGQVHVSMTFTNEKDIKNGMVYTTRDRHLP